MGVLDKLDDATPRRRTVDICLDAALEAEWEQLSLSLDAAAKADDEVLEHGASLEDPFPQTRARIEAMEELRDRMAASTVRFEFETADWSRRLELQASHPPRLGSLVDALQGWNTVTFTKAMIMECCTAVTDTDGDRATEIPEASWDKLLGRPEETDDDDGHVTVEAIKATLNFNQVNRLFKAAIDTTDGDTSVPPSARSLLENLASRASSQQPGPGTPPPSGSTGGNRRTSPRSSATKKAESSES